MNNKHGGHRVRRIQTSFRKTATELEGSAVLLVSTIIIPQYISRNRSASKLRSLPVTWSFDRLVPDILADEESPTSSKSDPDLDCDIPGPAQGHGPPVAGTGHGPHDECDKRDDHDPYNQTYNATQIRGASFIHWNGSGERRRRKLPEIPKNKICKYDTFSLGSGVRENGGCSAWGNPQNI